LVSVDLEEEFEGSLGLARKGPSRAEKERERVHPDYGRTDPTGRKGDGAASLSKEKRNIITEVQGKNSRRRERRRLGGFQKKKTF